MSQGIVDQLTSAFKVYSANPNAAKQAVAAAAQGQPIGPKGLAAAAALQQAPQAQTPAPQGTVMQHLAQQQGIMGQLPAMQGQLPPAQPQPEPEMGMAGGGLVSFAQGGVIPPDVLEAIQEHFAQGGAVRGFAGGNTVDAAPHLIPSSWVDAFESMMSPSPGRPRDVVEKERLEEKDKAARTPPSAVETAIKSFLSPSPGRARNAPEEVKEEKDTASSDKTSLGVTEQQMAKVFPSAGLGSLKQEGKQAGKQEPTTGASVTPRAVPNPEAKEAGYTPPEEQTIKTNSQATPASTEASPQGASSLMPGESYGIPSLEGQVKMLDELRGLSNAKMSDAQAKRLEEMQTGAKEDKWLGALMGMISGTLGSSSPYLGQAIGTGGIQALSAYQQGAKEEADIARKAYDIYGEEEKAPQLEHARNVDTILKLLQQKAEMASEERRAANRGRMPFEERWALDREKGIEAEKRAALVSGKTNAAIEHAALQQAVADYNAARDKGENPNFDQILTKARVQYGLTPLGLGGGELGGGGLGGGLTVTRQGVRQ
jgi:hypothetical protein